MKWLRGRASGASFVSAVVAASWMFAVSPSAAAEGGFFSDLQAARARQAKGDLARARREFLRLDMVAGGLPSTTYDLAQIAARSGQRAEALRRLRAYAAMGLWRPAGHDSSFAPLFHDSAFQRVVARLEANRQPIARATVLTVLDDPGLLTEDITYDSRSRAFYVSSIHYGKVLVIDSTGTVRDFVAAGSERGWGIYALAADPARNLLWGTVAATPTVVTYVAADSGRTGIVAWDLATGERRLQVDFPPDGNPHLLGDMTLAADGTLYATDSVGGALVSLAPGAPELEVLAAPGTFGSPQMPLVIEAGKRLWISDYPRGIVEFSLATRTVRQVPKPPSLALAGIDGMALAPDGIVAIQNGTAPIRVLHLRFDPAKRRILGARVEEQASPLLGEPNHGAVVGNTLYFIGNSGWDRVDRDEHLVVPDGATSPAILRITLDAARAAGH